MALREKEREGKLPLAEPAWQCAWLYLTIGQQFIYGRSSLGSSEVMESLQRLKKFFGRRLISQRKQDVFMRKASVDTLKPATDRHFKTGHHGRGDRDR